jgi:hypothetical protein
MIGEVRTTPVGMRTRVDQFGDFVEREVMTPR